MGSPVYIAIVQSLGISRNNRTVLTLTNFATLSISVVILTHFTNYHLSYDQQLHQDVHRLIVLIEEYYCIRDI